MSSLKKNQRFLTAKELIDRWQISELDLIGILSTGEIPIYDSKTLNAFSYGEKYLNIEYIGTMAFDFIDVERFEKDHPEYKPEPKIETGPLNAKERQEFGKLKNEREKWDESLKAAVHIGIFCSDKEDGSVKKDMVWDELFNNFPPIADTTIERIWKSIPSKYRKRAGRPRKDS